MTTDARRTSSSWSSVGSSGQLCTKAISCGHRFATIFSISSFYRQLVCRFPLLFTSRREGSGQIGRFLVFWIYWNQKQKLIPRIGNGTSKKKWRGRGVSWSVNKSSQTLFSSDHLLKMKFCLPMLYFFPLRAILVLAAATNILPSSSSNYCGFWLLDVN